jgi:hypothetical protein
MLSICAGCGLPAACTQYNQLRINYETPENRRDFGGQHTN